MKSSWLVIACSLLFFACENHSNHEGTNQEEAHHEEESKPLQLNGGEKWAANSEMMVFVRKMEGSISAFETSEEKAYQVLAADLQENVKDLVASCTMTGASHDELHKWLMPYMVLVKELTNSESDEQSKEVVDKIKASFREFNQYFE